MVSKYDGISVLDDVVITPTSSSGHQIKSLAGQKGTVIARNERGIVIRLHRGHVSVLAQRKEVEVASA